VPTTKVIRTIGLIITFAGVFLMIKSPLTTLKRKVPKKWKIGFAIYLIGFMIVLLSPAFER
jgi:uncharacterized membrane protein